MAAAVDGVILLIILGVAYAVMSEGLWGAALTFFNVMFAGLIAFNFYEPLADLLTKQAGDLMGFNDLICLMVPFAAILLMLRLTTDALAPIMVRFPSPIYHLGRIVFSFACAGMVVGLILICYDVAPVQKKLFGVVDYKRKPPFGLGVDHQWLGFFQYTSGQTFARYGYEQDPVQPGYGTARVFDPYGEWLVKEQNARPNGTETVPPPTSE